MRNVLYTVEVPSKIMEGIGDVPQTMVQIITNGFCADLTEECPYKGNSLSSLASAVSWERGRHARLKGASLSEALCIGEKVI